MCEGELVEDQAPGTADDGARERFEALAAEVVEPVRRFLARRTDRDTADDVLAETLLVCWRRLDELPDPALPWVYGVARHCLANAGRSDRRDRIQPHGPGPRRILAVAARGDEGRVTLCRIG